MHLLKTLLTVLTVVYIGVAQDINVSGTVMTIGSTGISGAEVMLEFNGASTTTGSDGSFTLTATGINPHFHNTPIPILSARINNDVLHLYIHERSPVEIVTYNLQGKIVSHVQKEFEAGKHVIKQPQLGTGVFIHSIKTCSGELMIKNISLPRISVGKVSNTAGTQATALSFNNLPGTLFKDVISVVIDSYLDYRVKITNPDTGGIEIVMKECADTVRDADGNLYQAVSIGSQVWTVRNLRTTKYNDGTPIPHVPDSAAWYMLTTPGYCYHRNTTNADFIKKYGALYNWYALDTKKLAPAGWHVPTDEEWFAFRNYLITNGYNWDGTTTEDKIAKSIAARTDWYTASLKGAVGYAIPTNNITGFSALPGSYRSRVTPGDFNLLGLHSRWWSATDYDSSHAYYHDLFYARYNLEKSGIFKRCGHSVRLLKD
jgi:uncharacterized protein (TIGR02145 family)